jgi:hypothetical protein
MAWAKTFADAKDASDWTYLWAAVFSCGYSQPHRDEISEDLLLRGIARTDCSYGVNYSLWKGGLLPECVGFSTRTMIDYLEANGFTLHSARYTEPQRNDVLWRSGHTAMYIGDGLQGEALRTEKGDAGYSGDTPGDQDGGETVVRAYDPSDWTYILRPPKQPDPPKQGWIEEDGAWYFYEDGEKVCNRWEKTGGFWYYLGEDGAMVKSDWVKTDGKWYYLQADGKMFANGWLEIDGEWYFFEHGAMLSGQPVKWKDGWCWLDSHGVCVEEGLLTITDWMITD